MTQSSNSTGIASRTGLASGLGDQDLPEVAAIIAIAVIVVGALIGLMLAAMITQFPFIEKVITPYILLLVTTPMLALVAQLILCFGFGFTPRIIAVAIASGPMVMINTATGIRRVDGMKIALGRSCRASSLQIFTKIRIPMVIVGLMVGAIFGMITNGRSAAPALCNAAARQTRKTTSEDIRWITTG